MGDCSVLKQKILTAYHNSSVGGHSGIDKTTRRIKRTLYWKNLKNDVQQFIGQCDICQRFKSEAVKYPGVLQPLQIPEKIWSDISMDFIEGLPASHGKSVILVVVDRLSKYGHFHGLISSLYS